MSQAFAQAPESQRQPAQRQQPQEQQAAQDEPATAAAATAEGAEALSLQRHTALAQELLKAQAAGNAAVALHDAERLVAIRSGGVAALNDRLGEISQQTVALNLIIAAQGLLVSLEALLHDEELWRRLIDAEYAVYELNRQDALLIREVLDHDIVSVLPTLGYRPPPTELELASLLQESFEDMLVQPREGLAYPARVARAREELIWFLLRMRRVVERDDKRATGTDRHARRSARIRLAAWVRRAAETTGPAALAAGITASVLGSDAGLVAGLAAGGTEMFKRTVELAATDATARTLGRGGLPEEGNPAGDIYLATNDAVHWLEAAVNEAHPEEALAANVFMLRRTLNRALQAEASSGVWTRFQAQCDHMLDLLRRGDTLEAIRYWRGVTSPT